MAVSFSEARPGAPGTPHSPPQPNCKAALLSLLLRSHLNLRVPFPAHSDLHPGSTTPPPATPTPAPSACLVHRCSAPSDASRFDSLFQSHFRLTGNRAPGPPGPESCAGALPDNGLVREREQGTCQSRGPRNTVSGGHPCFSHSPSCSPHSPWSLCLFPGHQGCPSMTGHWTPVAPLPGGCVRPRSHAPRHSLELLAPTPAPPHGSECSFPLPYSHPGFGDLYQKGLCDARGWACPALARMRLAL